MAARKKRGRRHPGVVLMRPHGKHGWRGRYPNPDHVPGGTEPKLRTESLPATATTVETRELWAVAKSEEIRRRREALAAGAVRRTGAALSDAIDTYLKAHPHLRQRTRDIYGRAGARLVAWAAAAGVKSCDELTRARVMAFREYLIALPKRVADEGGKRGARVAASVPRSAIAVNQELRATRTILAYLCDRDSFPFLPKGDLSTALKQLTVPTKVIEYLKPAELRTLLGAALRHDAEVFTETRKEHAGGGDKGTTTRYTPIAPFVALVTLTGMRFGEALGLDWSQVDLEAGEIRLAGNGTKTNKGRRVHLDVSPGLAAMLAAQRLAQGNPSTGPVFELSDGTAYAGAERLCTEYGAPASFTWQMLRRTCGSFLTNAPGIFGAASAYRSAKQLGHSVQVAEQHYTDVVRGIPADARTLEAAMGIEVELTKIIDGRPRGAQVLQLHAGGAT